MPASSGSFTWTLPADLPGGSDYAIRVMSVSDGKILDVSNTTFTITPAATLTVVTPNGGESWAVGSTHTITWNASGDAGIVNVALLKAGVGYKSLATNISATQGSFSWTLAAYLPAAGDYTIRVMTADGTLLDVSNSAFNIAGP